MACGLVLSRTEAHQLSVVAVAQFVCDMHALCRRQTFGMIGRDEGDGLRERERNAISQMHASKTAKRRIRVDTASRFYCH